MFSGQELTKEAERLSGLRLASKNAEKSANNAQDAVSDSVCLSSNLPAFLSVLLSKIPSGRFLHILILLLRTRAFLIKFLSRDHTRDHRQ